MRVTHILNLQYTFNSHLHPLDLDAPGVCGLVEAALHDVRDGLALREYFRQVLGAEDVAQGGGGEEAGGVAEIGGELSKKVSVNFRNTAKQPCKKIFWIN